MWLYGELQSADHVFVWRFQFVEKHFLVEHLGEGAAHRRHYPDPVRGAPSPRLLLVLHVLHERLGGRVVVRDGHAHLLKKDNKWCKKKADLRKDSNIKMADMNKNIADWMKRFLIE